MIQPIGLPQVITARSSPGQAKLVLAIAPHLPAFAGHFDEVPIVPGVVQIEWALAFAGLYFPELVQLEVDQMDSIKFQNIITPETEVTLTLEHTQNNLQFAFTSDGGRHSSGKLRLN